MQPILPFNTGNDAAGYTVQYHPYDPVLSAVFGELNRLIQQASGPRVVEHVGSTSIPGIGGRNAIDIALPVNATDRLRVHDAMVTLGFQDSPFPHYLPLLVGRFSWLDKVYPVLLYLVAPDSDVYQGWLKFRAHMRASPADARAYDTVKRHAAAAGSMDGEAYQAAKTPFLQSVAAKLL